ncbi:MAG: hypothetical protein KF861_23695, partial [Planctomycetaceae bacterium]|nr:hypothetical protein [Planctomycetaceae bacterium]
MSFAAADADWTLWPNLSPALSPSTTPFQNSTAALELGDIDAEEADERLPWLVAEDEDEGEEVDGDDEFEEEDEFDDEDDFDEDDFEDEDFDDED